MLFRKRPLLLILCVFAFLPLTRVYAKITTADSLEKILQKPDLDRIFRLRVMLKLGYVYCETGNYDKAEASDLEGLRLARVYKNQFFEGNALDQLGVMEKGRGKLQKALKYFEQAIIIGVKLRSDSLLSSAYNNTGNLYLTIGDYPKSFTYYYKALAVYEKLNDKRNIGLLINNIGNNHLYQNEYKEAMGFFDKAYKLQTEINDNYNLVYTLLNISTAAFNLSDHKKSLEYNLKALKIAKEYKHFNGICIALSNIGPVYRKMNMKQKALESNLEALQFSESNDDQIGVLYTLINLCSSYYDLKRYAEAEKTIQRCIDLSKKLGALDLLKAAYEEQAEMYRIMGRNDLSIKSLRLFIALKDSLFNSEKHRQIAELQTKYETNKKTQEIEILNKNKEIITLEQAKTQQQRNMLVVISLALVFLIAGTIYNFITRSRLSALRYRQNLSAERRRISRDLHDHVGSQLVYISQKASTPGEENSEQLKLVQIADISKNVIKNLRETIWTLYTEEITSTDLALKVNSIAEKLIEDSPIKLELSPIPSQLIQLTPSQGINLYRIAQEVISNAVKHSKAQKISIKYGVDKKSFTIAITDDGVGIEASGKNDGEAHYGLSIMQERAKEIGAHFELNSSPKQGTTVQVRV